MNACRAFGLSGPFRLDVFAKGRGAWYRVFCFDCRWEETVRTKARAQRAGNQHLREMRRAS